MEALDHLRLAALNLAILPGLAAYLASFLSNSQLVRSKVKAFKTFFFGGRK
jgi:hypothetical protein